MKPDDSVFVIELCGKLNSIYADRETAERVVAGLGSDLLDSNLAQVRLLAFEARVEEWVVQ